jgi:hypothetical protein
LRSLVRVMSFGGGQGGPQRSTPLPRSAGGCRAFWPAQGYIDHFSRPPRGPGVVLHRAPDTFWGNGRHRYCSSRGERVYYFRKQSGIPGGDPWQPVGLKPFPPFPVYLIPRRYVPVRYIPAFLRPLTFHP